jgi:hypothetical protein
LELFSSWNGIKNSGLTGLQEGGYMMNEKDVTYLLEALERIALDYKTMQHMLNHSHPEGPLWVRRLGDSLKEVEPLVDSIFDEVRGKIQSGQSFDNVIPTLRVALNRVSL